jgi:glutamyl-tRNA synthetase
MKVRTRFAPSPTGTLHIGGARTAIFNWLFAKKYKGDFYLRIEDTDKERSNEQYIESIQCGLKWLGLNWDKDIVFQSANIKRHVDVVKNLVDEGKAYYCYATQEEIQDFKTKNPGKKFISEWRDKVHYKKDLNPVIRLRTLDDGITILQDDVLGRVEVSNSEMDDMVLLRSDGTPTYLISCVIDDYDMKITHVIRGNDHLTNTFRQLQIIKALDWHQPKYAHIPLIHSSDGSKMSKRDGALGVDEYENLGYLPQAIFNYLLKLGWSYNDEEIISSARAIDVFDLKDVNKSPARFDLDKLKFINQHYIKLLDDEIVFNKIISKINKELLNEGCLKRIKKSIPLIKSRGQIINDLIDLASIFISYSNPIDDQSKDILALDESKQLLKNLLCIFEEEQNWDAETLKQLCSNFAKELNIKTSIIMKALRAGVLGTFKSPPIYETLEILTKKEVISRISQIIN